MFKIIDNSKLVTAFLFLAEVGLLALELCLTILGCAGVSLKFGAILRMIFSLVGLGATLTIIVLTALYKLGKKQNTVKLLLLICAFVVVVSGLLMFAFSFLDNVTQYNNLAATAEDSMKAIHLRNAHLFTTAFVAFLLISAAVLPFAILLPIKYAKSINE